MALDALDRLMLSFEPEPRVAVMGELQLVALPAGRDMASIAFLLTKAALVRILVAIRADVVLCPEGRHVQQAVLCRGFVAFDALDCLMLSFEPELRVAVMGELQLLAPPAGRRMTGIASLLIKAALVRVLVAIQACIMAQAEIVSGRIIAVVAPFPCMTFFAFGLFMLSFQRKVRHGVIELLFVEVYDAARGTGMFFMAMNALLFFLLAVIPYAGLPSFLNDLVAGKAFALVDLTVVLVTFLTVIDFF